MNANSPQLIANLDWQQTNSPDAQRMHQLLPGVPHIESPFFAAYFADPSVDESVRKIAFDLHTKGYAMFNFPEPEFEQVSKAIKSNLHSKFDFAHWQEVGHAAGISMREMNAWKYDDYVKRLACNEQVIALLSRLYGRQAWPFQTLNFPTGTQQHFHTDSIHFSSVPERFMCGVWVALEDVDADNGPLEYFPGSHQWPLYTNEHIGRCVTGVENQINQSIYEKMWEEMVAAKHAKSNQFFAKKGQGLIWAANLLHGGSKQLDPQRTRWSQVTHYFFDDCVYYTPMHSDPFYGSIDFRTLRNIVTGEIMPQRYVGRDIQPAIPKSHVLSELYQHGFDAKLYLAANPDVAKGNIDPYEHFLTFGIKEKRKLR